VSCSLPSRGSAEGSSTAANCEGDDAQRRELGVGFADGVRVARGDVACELLELSRWQRHLAAALVDGRERREDLLGAEAAPAHRSGERKQLLPTPAHRNYIRDGWRCAVCADVRVLE
jgi:hypothetical protein